MMIRKEVTTVSEDIPSMPSGDVRVKVVLVDRHPFATYQVLRWHMWTPCVDGSPAHPNGHDLGHRLMLIGLN